jgi:hypothetical protein
MSLLRSFGNILARGVYKYFVPNGTKKTQLKRSLPILRRLFRVFEFFFTPPVTARLDQLARGGEIFL